MALIKLVLILVLCLLVRSDIPPNTSSNFTDISTTQSTESTNSTAPITILTRSQCHSFSSNSKTFDGDKSQMVRNLTKTILLATSHLDVIDSFKYYSNPFISEFIQTAKGLQLLEDYRDRLNAKFGVEVVNEFVQNRYPGCACVECEPGIFSYSESVGVSNNLLDQEEIAETLDGQVYKPLIYLPVNKFPRFQLPSRRLLQTQFPSPSYWNICVERSEGRAMQISCIHDCLYQDFNQVFPLHSASTPGDFHPSLSNLLDNGDHLSDIEEGFVDENMIGLPYFILNQRNFRRLVLDSHANCNNGIYADFPK